MTDRIDHAVVVPIYTSSTYLRQSPHYPDRTSLVYGRMTCPNYTEAEKMICKLYQSCFTILTPSGLNALSCTLEGLFDLWNTITIIADTELYSSSHYLLSYLMKRNQTRIQVLFEDFTEEKKIHSILERGKKNRKYILYCESCSNPSGRMIHLDHLSQIAKEQIGENNYCFVVDNSWLSTAFNPLSHGAHILIESASKYMGAGDIIMGVITMKEKKWHDPIKVYTKQNGIRVSPMDAYTLCKSLETLSLRLEKSATTAMKLASWLESKDKPTLVQSVLYPLLKSHPTYEVAKELIQDGGPSTFVFCVEGAKKTVTSLMDQSSIILFATSYGKAVSLFDPWPKQKKEGTWIRLAVGFQQSFEEIQNELKRLFS